ncbi:thiamine phosphate synthase [Aquabacterium sp. A08]|uniref:thiamine phosphate synthase n=1 Tax=Aquabacterium sp. A08 TaxID=2718532 RepID=UPI00141F5492|nr:thiamine phosphate synthase [Aquabacterium sp. A08]NIC42668.1 thiamine phosphate synthase [Aquabacterium sp. A08]NIC42676.1 thiamine phosphate synthase [Aquabacterium sp. A08]
MTPSHERVQALAQPHAALGLPSHADPHASASDDGVRAIAHAAARRLGFIEADAACIAAAWARQTERTGGFDPLCWPSEPTDFGLADAQAPAFPACPHELGVYAVLPDAAWVRRMAVAGLPTVQLRFKSSDRSAIRAEVAAAVAAVQGTGSLLFINDHWREAIDAGAYGVHLGQEDLDALPAEALTALRASGVRLGVSTHGYAEMLRAAAVRPSYLALGAVFPTTLKAMATPPQGLARLAAYARLMRDWPLVAIGGIALEHLPAVAATGVGSFAVVRAITGAADPEAAARGLVEAWNAARAKKCPPFAESPKNSL